MSGTANLTILCYDLVTSSIPEHAETTGRCRVGLPFFLLRQYFYFWKSNF